MRKIIFRGKRTDNGEWVYGYLVKMFGMLIITARYPEFFCEIVPETVGQYTGVKDKNGKMIFEGDIVKFSHPAFKKSKIGFIDWEENEVGFVLRITDDYTYFAYLGDFYEVIGNKWDNKEVLNDKL